MTSNGNTAKTMLETALARIWKRSRFTSYFYQSVDLIEESEMPTLALLVFRARLVLYYSPDFIRKRSLEEIIGLLVHEMLHVTMNHDHRTWPEEEIYLQNLAQDMVINSYITRNRNRFFSRKGTDSEEIPPLILPPGLPSVPEEYIEVTGQPDPSWEALYTWLKQLGKKQLKEIKQRSDVYEETDGIPLNSEQSALNHLNETLQNPLNIPDEYHPDESFVTVNDQTGLTLTDSKGRQLPTGVHMMMGPEAFQQQKAKKDGLIRFAAGDSRCLEERAFQQIHGLISEVRQQPPAPWVHKIKSLVDVASQSVDFKYTHSRFNRRYVSQGIYSAGRIYEDKGRITVAIDVSGSVVMQPEMLEAAFGVVDDLTRKYTVNLVCIDEQLFVPRRSNDRWIQSGLINKPYNYKRGDWKYIQTGSMGTTFFGPLFNDYLKDHREMVLVITDGQIYDLEKLNPYHPTLWILPDSRQHCFTPPFGQKVSMQLSNRG